MPKPMPAAARSLRIAILTAASRSLERMSARETTGRTLTRVDRRRMVVMSEEGSVGRVRRGLLATGSSRMRESWSGCEKLFARARGGASGAGICDGTI